VRTRRSIPLAAAWALFFAVLLAALAITWFAIRHHAEPLIRERIVESLEVRLRTEVELDEVHVSFRHGLEVNGTGLKVMSIGNRARITPGGVPMLTVRSFQFDTTFGDLLFHHQSAVTAYAQGLIITLPAANDRAILPPADPAKSRQPRDSLLLNKLVATDSTLVLESADPTKLPIIFDFNKLILVDPGKNLPFDYETILTNPKPIGEIHSVGHVNAWNFASPRDTPVDGNFTLDHVDLGSIAGLEGHLTASGRITGTLGQMAVHGITDSPDFALDISAHPFAAHNEFQALVDGTNGNVALQANGLITRTVDVPGHFIAIDIHVHNGRAEDLLTLFAKSSPPMLNGAISLAGHVDVPPGKQRIVLKMRVRGTASINSATWFNPSLQEKVDAFSLRAQDVGKAGQAIHDPAASPVVASTIAGPFTIRNGNIEIPSLTYKLKGATLVMDGTYPLVNHEIDFHGVARTVASASHLESGWKSLLLKPISPFLHKNGAGTELPVSFTGDKSHPAFALDLKDRKADSQLSAAHPTPPK
jgi:hypothetical protein